MDMRASMRKVRFSFLRVREPVMPSFDIVSDIDLAEADNAVANVMREIAGRYDFKGSKSSVELKDGVITIFADDDMKLRQMHEILQGHMQKRGIEPGSLDYQKVEPAAGQSVRQPVRLKQGIDKEFAKKLVKAIKDEKFKVQVAIQGEELRVTGKKRDDLQAVIAFVKGLQNEQPLQFKNFRD
jgi:uncharacterized protein YajQ (UPF0234 family)